MEQNMSRGNVTLNDIAALIVQIEPTDLEELAHVRWALRNVAESSSLSVRRPMAEAIKKIDQMMEEKGADSSGFFADIGILVEEAIDVMERSNREEPPFSSLNHDPVRTSGQSEDMERFNGLPPEADPALLEEFISESRDLVANAEIALLELETDPENTEAVNTIFRAFHTIKGTSAFLGLDHISALAHGAESFLSRIHRQRDSLYRRIRRSGISLRGHAQGSD